MQFARWHFARYRYSYGYSLQKYGVQFLSLDDMWVNAIPRIRNPCLKIVAKEEKTNLNKLPRPHHLT